MASIRSSQYIARLAILTATTLAFEMVGLPQPFTGPLVNMMLILTALFLGPGAGILLGIITPLAAVLRGQLPAPLLPMIPFIAIGNALLVVTFSLIYQKDMGKRWYFFRLRSWAGVVIAAVVKFIWLSTAVYFIMPLVLGVSLPDVFVTMMALPQLFTALIGGSLALFLFDLIMRKRLREIEDLSNTKF